MSSAQIEDLLAPVAPLEPIEVLVDPPDQAVPKKQDVDLPPQKVECAPQSLEASEILSQPPMQEETSCTSKILKTRKGLIQQIRTVCRERGIDSKPLNLARRRKNSLKGILQEQLREAIQNEMNPTAPPEHQERMGTGPQKI